MCGITGWIDWEKPVKQVEPILSAMVETLAVRGPDASGTYLKGCTALGHRRLSVVDPIGGAQPMIRRQGDYEYAITYNGELYNTSEIQHELVLKGHSFTTHSDTEVLLKAYMEWGPECVEKFNGIFAFAIWDEKEQRLFMARDRIGVKPFFYAKRGALFLFGSEVKALLAHPLIQPIVDSEGLAEIFALGPARTPGHGIYLGVHELKAGHMAIYTKAGLNIRRYWSLESREHEDSFDKTVDTVRTLVQDAVVRQLVADVPVCTLLSGGLDSSALTAIVVNEYRKQGGEKLHTYSVDYPDNEQFFTANAFQPNSDTPWVKRMADFLQTHHHNIIVTIPELAQTLQAATLARDFPGMADVDTSLYLFCKEIRKGATVALSGECADEIFGGYPWFRRPDMIAADTFPWSNHVAYRSEWLRPEIRDYIKPEAYSHARYEEALAEVPALPGEEKAAARMREIFYLSLTRFMPTLLDRKDRMSMAFGLEVRVPFCDHRIVDYVWNVPWPMKNYQDREKGLLRHALTGWLPEDVLWRKKSPYPKTYHPLYYELVKTEALEIINDTQAPLNRFIDGNKIREYAQTDEPNANIPWFGQLMSKVQLFAYLIQVNAWLKTYHVEVV